MNSFRTPRPLLVNATQCLHHTLILTDAGQPRPYPADPIIEAANPDPYNSSSSAKTSSIRTRQAQPRDAHSIHQLIDVSTHDGTLLRRSYTEICVNIRTFTIVETDNHTFLGCAALHGLWPSPRRGARR